MKSRTALPLLCALYFLMISVATGSAQQILTPYVIDISLDASHFTYDLSQRIVPQYIIHGTVANDSPDPSDSLALTVNMEAAPQWVIATKIDGRIMVGGDTIRLAPVGGKLPIEIIISPYAERPDSESYCLSFSYRGRTQGEECIGLSVTDTKSGVSAGAPAPKVMLTPNPARNTITVRGLDRVRSGYRYQIYLLNGAEVLHGTLPTSAHINIQDLSSGTYRLLLFDGEETIASTPFTVLH